MNFKHIYPFLVLFGTFFEKFILNINNEYVQDCPCPGATFAFCSNEEKSYLEVAPGQLKSHVNSYRRQTMHRGKVDPGVGELSRDHVNRP